MLRGALLCIAAVSAVPAFGQSKGAPVAPAKVTQVAQTPATTPAPQAQLRKTAKVAQPAAGPSTSASLRETRKNGIGVAYGSLANGMLGYGLETFRGVSSSYQVGIMFLHGSEDYSDRLNSPETQKYGSMKGQGTSDVVMLENRFFLGNSFALNAGLGYRQIKVSVNAEDNSKTQNFEAGMSSQSLLLHGGIANYWTLDSGIFIGMNWLGYAVSVSSGYKSDSSTKGLSSSDAAAIQELSRSTAQKFGEMSGVTLSGVLGYQF